MARHADNVLKTELFTILTNYVSLKNVGFDIYNIFTFSITLWKVHVLYSGVALYTQYGLPVLGWDCKDYVKLFIPL